MLHSHLLIICHLLELYENQWKSLLIDFYSLRTQMITCICKVILKEDTGNSDKSTFKWEMTILVSTEPLLWALGSKKSYFRWLPGCSSQTCDFGMMHNMWRPLNLWQQTMSYDLWYHCKPVKGSNSQRFCNVNNKAYLLFQFINKNHWLCYMQRYLLQINYITLVILIG